MAKVTCTRPNASEHISGVYFVRQDDGSVVAEGVSPEQAAQFVDFEGFTVEEDGESKETASKGKKAKAEPVD
jgi:hypothetical protein